MNIIFLVCVCLVVRLPEVFSAPPALSSFDDRVNDLLGKMNDEEKVGQMVQITINLILKNAALPWDQIEVDPAKLAVAIQGYKVGSILNVAETGAYSLSQWHDIITQIQNEANRTQPFIPVLYGIDSIHGANYIQNAVLFPQATGLAATFNPSLATDLGKIVAHQTRAAAIPWAFHPQVDIGRQKLWPRLWETYGEDVKLVKDMGRAYTEGMQGNNLTSRETVAACLKHYVGYGMPLSGRDRTPAWIDDRHMLEYFLPPFEESIRAGAVSVMVNSGEVNGIPGHANYHLLTEMLKNTFQFEGFAVSDWEDIIRLHTRDRTASTPKEAACQAVAAGVDMSMVPFDYSFYNLTLECVRDGSVSQERLDDAVRRILRVKYALGLFDGHNAWPDPNSLNTFNKPEFDAKNLQAAREGITLLKNDANALPFVESRITTTNKLVITGPTANVLTSLNGGWSYTWQGDNADIYPKNLTNKTILESFRKRLGPTRIDYFNSSSFDELFDIDALLNAAQSASYILVCLGEKPYTETAGNINDLTLDDAQLTLVEALRNRTNVPIITVLVQGRPRLIRRIVDKSSAILMAYLPGMEGGQALVDILLGVYNPSGRLPITYPRYNQHLSTYDYKWSEVSVGNYIEVEFPFGHGLSYSTFIYSNLNVPSSVKWNDSFTISVNVRNSGPLAGDHTVLLFISDQYRSVTPPNKELKGYNKQNYAVGQERTVQFTLTRHDLSFIGLNLTRQSEAGDFTVSIGDRQANFTLQADPLVTTTSAPPPVTTAIATEFSYSLFSLVTLLLCSFLI